MNVNVGLEDKRKIEVKNCVEIDGREIALAQARHKQEIHERAGFNTTPWARLQAAEYGAEPGGAGLK
jgi:hypothetical protein